MSSLCSAYYLIVEPLLSSFAVYPIGRLPRGGNWLLDERILTMVNQLSMGCLYLDCARMNTTGSGLLSNMAGLCRMVTNRNSRVILCNLQPQLKEFIRVDLHEYLRLFDIHDDGVPGGTGPRLPDPSCISWNNGTIPKLAQAIYDDRAFDHLPILADALEEAGCTNQDILDHCRQQKEHVRGCWVVDLLLGPFRPEDTGLNEMLETPRKF